MVVGALGAIHSGHVDCYEEQSGCVACIPVNWLVICPKNTAGSLRVITDCTCSTVIDWPEMKFREDTKCVCQDFRNVAFCRSCLVYKKDLSGMELLFRYPTLEEQ